MAGWLTLAYLLASFIAGKTLSELVTDRPVKAKMIVTLNKGRF